MLLTLIENGIEMEKRRQREFFDLAHRFRGDLFQLQVLLEAKRQHFAMDRRGRR
jgi:hypothetical protein